MQTKECLVAYTLSRKIPSTNKDSAELSEAFDLSIARGRTFVSPIFGTHVPIGNEHIGCWRIGRELEECLKCLHIPACRKRRGFITKSLRWSRRLDSRHFNATTVNIRNTYISVSLKVMQDAITAEKNHPLQKNE